MDNLYHDYDACSIKQSDAGTLAEDIEALTSDLNTQIEAVLGTDWQGKGAAAFGTFYYDQLAPSLNNLEDCFYNLKNDLGRISETCDVCENDGKSFFDIITAALRLVQRAFQGFF